MGCELNLERKVPKADMRMQGYPGWDARGAPRVGHSLAQSGEGRRCTEQEPALLGGSRRTSVRAESCRRPGPPAGRAGRMRAEDAGRARARAGEANLGDSAERKGGP